MNLPHIWGEGQLFAFSAMDGVSLASDDFPGYLSKEAPGIVFCITNRRTLSFEGINPSEITINTVVSDYINYTYSGDTYRILYACHHLIIGDMSENVYPSESLEYLGLFRKHITELEIDGETVPVNCYIQDSEDGEITALVMAGSRFSYVFGHSDEEVISLGLKGLSMDIDACERKKLSFYESLSLSVPDKYKTLATKCVSVMRTQLYSPEAEFDTIWSTPDRLPHKKLWLWDSVFHAIGHMHINPSLAEDLIHSIFIHQEPSGFIPHMAFINLVSNITQPPIIAWGSLKVYEKTKNKAFLEEVYSKNKRFLEWVRDNRKYSDLSTTVNGELYIWNLTDDVNCRCDESGMDNSPRFDTDSPLCAIDYACFMANETECMAKIAKELSLFEDEAMYHDWSRRIKEDINHTLYSESDGFYFDYDTKNHKLHKVWSIASFLPFFAGVCNEEQAGHLVDRLTDTMEFGTTFPVPSISLKDSTYGTDMWRGPVWINFNYMLIEGLFKYGFNELASDIRDKTIHYMNSWYEENGCIYEFYDSENKKAPSRLNRKGIPYEPYDFYVRYQTIRDYGWSSTLLFDLLLSLK